MSGQTCGNIQIDGVQLHGAIVELIHISVELILIIQSTIDILIAFFSSRTALCGEIQPGQNLSRFFLSQNNLHSIDVVNIIVGSVHSNNVLGVNAVQFQFSSAVDIVRSGHTVVISF